MTADARGAADRLDRLRIRAGLVALGWLIVGLGPVRRVASIHQGYGIRAVAVGVIALAACLALAVKRGGLGSRWAPFVVTLVAAGSGAAAGGRIVGVWLVPTTLLAAWVVFGRWIPVRPPFDRRSLAPVLSLVLLSAYLARDAERLVGSLVVLSAAWVAAAVLCDRGSLVGGVERHMIDGVAWIRREAIRVPPLIRRDAARIGRTFKRGVIRLARAIQRGARLVLIPLVLLPLWAVVAMVPWACQRLLRVDPMSRGTPRGVTWITRRDDGEEPSRLWFVDPGRHRPSLPRRIHNGAPALLALGLLVGVVVGVNSRSEATAQNASPPPMSEAERALREPPWFEELQIAGNDAVRQMSFSQYVGNEWPDFASPNLNITAGRRHTWRSAECPDSHVVVWFFGGSTAFGINQRDDFTLPSALAKEAEARGYHLDVVNWGNVGDVSWQQNRRLERALASEEPPDIVVYYDGFNDLRVINDMDFTGRNPVTPDFIGPMDRKLERILTQQRGFPNWGERTLVRVPVPEAELEPDEVVDLFSTTYATADHLARLITADAGISFFHLYQPGLDTRRPLVDGEPGPNPDYVDLTARVRSRLPAEVIDMGDVLNDVDTPLFYDEVHTVESANDHLAVAMIDEMTAPIEGATAERAPCQ